jgi:hypothetical protein
LGVQVQGVSGSATRQGFQVDGSRFGVLPAVASQIEEASDLTKKFGH